MLQVPVVLVECLQLCLQPHHALLQDRDACVGLSHLLLVPFTLQSFLLEPLDQLTVRENEHITNFHSALEAGQDYSLCVNDLGFQ